MPKLTPTDANDILNRCGVATGDNFFGLDSGQREALLAEARTYGYREPRNANGSRCRYWHAHLVRVASRADA